MKKKTEAKFIHTKSISEVQCFDNIQDYYELGLERNRLSLETGMLELVRAQEILTRYLPLPPAIILDVGGAAGVYALWLAKQGYEVHLVDPLPLHIEQAKNASENQSDYPIASFSIEDARKLGRSDDSIDVVLFLGPLYHLTDKHDRLTALREANRVLRNHGLIFAAGISRFASTLDGIFRSYSDDPDFARIAERDLINGQHRNPTNNPNYFTTAYFHLPEEMQFELEEAGFKHAKTVAIEGPGWLLQNFNSHWHDPNRRKRLLQAMRTLEEEPSVLGVSAHIMAIARK